MPAIILSLLGLVLAYGMLRYGAVLPADWSLCALGIGIVAVADWLLPGVGVLPHPDWPSSYLTFWLSRLLCCNCSRFPLS